MWAVAASAAGSVAYVLAKTAAVLPGRAAAAGKGPEPMLVLSLSLAVAHLAVAYRTSCRERRRLLVYRIDVEAVSTASPVPRLLFLLSFPLQIALISCWKK